MTDTAVRPPAGLTLAQVIDACPALLALHGGSTQAFRHYLYRCAAPPAGNMKDRRAGCGSGRRQLYDLQHLRLAALRLMISRVIADKAALDDEDLAASKWYPPNPGRPYASVTVGFHDREGVLHARLSIDVPDDLWSELWPNLRPAPL